MTQEDDGYCPSEARLQRLHDAMDAREARLAEADSCFGVPSRNWLHAARRARINGHLPEAEWLLRQLCEAASRVQRLRPNAVMSGGPSAIELALLYRRMKRYEDEVDLYENMNASVHRGGWQTVTIEKARARAAQTPLVTQPSLPVPLADTGVQLYVLQGEVLDGYEFPRHLEPLRWLKGVTLIADRRSPTLTFPSGLVLSAYPHVSDRVQYLSDEPCFLSQRHPFYFACEAFVGLVHFTTVPGVFRLLERYSSRAEALILANVEAQLTGQSQPDAPAEAWGYDSRPDSNLDPWYADRSCPEKV